MTDLNILINGETNPMKYRMADEIASVLMGQQPEHAHMYALEQIIKGHNPDLWRSVLTELDKLEAKYGRTQMGGGSGGHSAGQRDKPESPRCELSHEDGVAPRRQSASSGVDESSL